MGEQLSFVAVGPQRTASSWLDRALRDHPDVILPANVKETFYFDRHFDRGEDWYWSLFESGEARRLRGEVGSTYFESGKARERIFHHNPNAKIIILVRNPVARSFSSFGHEYAKGRASGGFWKTVEAQPRVIDSGRYAELAPLWEDEFGSDQVCYVVQEDIAADPQGQLDALCEFLGIAPMELPESLRQRYGQGTVPRFRWLAGLASRTASVLRTVGMHRVVETGKWLGLKKVFSGGNPATLSMTRPVFQYLLAEHAADIRFLEMRLGRSFQHWRDPATYGLEDKA